MKVSSLLDISEASDDLVAEFCPSGSNDCPSDASAPEGINVVLPVG